MDWLIALFRDNSVAHAVLVLSLVVSAGLALGNVRVLGLSLSVGGVLFAGLAFGHMGLSIAPELMDFLREFGLILFVYAIGLQVGPGFFSSFRKQGLSLNLLAIAIILGGTLIAICLALATHLEKSVIVGLLSGAVTNTPSLGAAQQALKDLRNVSSEAAEMVGLGYAIAYPFGIVGIISTMHIVRKVFRIDLEKEAKEFERLQRREVKPIGMKDIEVLNANLAGRSVDQLTELIGPGVVVTRVFRNGQQSLATPEWTLEMGDIVHAVGTENRLDNFRLIVGKESDIQMPSLPSQISVRRVVVTKKNVVGKDIDTLDLDERYGVIITRIIRSGVEFTPTKGLKVQFGDRLAIVGEERALERAAKELGDSLRDLEKPQIIPIFVGIALGVLVGSWPVALPHMPAPVKLGLAGGPLLVAIALGSTGKLGPLLTFMPNAAKTLLREFGIAIFLACVGLKSGERLIGLLLSGHGFYWMGLGILITFLPILVVAIIARAWRKLNFVDLCGLLSGSMTDPPALAYATQLFKNDAPSIAYATVYPLTMLLRVVIAQVFVIVALH